jgi:hypothetical protein
MVSGDIRVKVIPDTTLLDKELKKKRTFAGILGISGIGGAKPEKKDVEGGLVKGIEDRIKELNRSIKLAPNVGDIKKLQKEKEGAEKELSEALGEDGKKSNKLLGGILKSVGAIFGLNILFSGLFRLLKPFVELFTALSFLVWFPLWKALKPALEGLSKFVKNVAAEGGGVTGLIKGGAKTVEEGLEGESVFKRIGIALIAGIIGLIVIVGVAVLAGIALIPALIIAAVAAVVTLLILAWDPLVALFKIIVQAFKDFWISIKEAWTITIDFFKKMGGGIKKVWNSFIDKIKSGFNSLVEKIKGFGSILKDAFIFLKDKLISTFKAIINGIISGINAIIPGTRFDVPHLANGGIVTKPTLAVVGERGPEAVIPLSKAGGFGGGSVTQHINVQATINNDMDIRSLAVRLAELSKDELAMSTGSQRF